MAARQAYTLCRLCTSDTGNRGGTTINRSKFHAPAPTHNRNENDAIENRPVNGKNNRSAPKWPPPTATHNNWEMPDASTCANHGHLHGWSHGTDARITRGQAWNRSTGSRMRGAPLTTTNSTGEDHIVFKATEDITPPSMYAGERAAPNRHQTSEGTWPWWCELPGLMLPVGAIILATAGSPAGRR